MAELNDALRVISDLGRVLEKASSDYKDNIGDVSRLYATTKRGADKNNQLAQEANFSAVKKTTDNLQRLYKKTAEWEAETKMYTKATQTTTKGLKKYAKHLKDTSPANASRELLDAFEKLETQTDFTADEMHDLQRIIRESIQIENKVAAQEYVKLQRTKLMTEGLDRLREKTVGLGVSFERIKSGLVGSIDELEFAQAHQIGTYGLLDQGLESFSKKMQLAPQSFQEMINQNKALVASTGKNYSSLEGATGQFVDSMSKAGNAGLTLTEQAIRLTGNSEKAGKLMSASMKAMAGIGVSLTGDELRDGTSRLMKDFQKLAQISNKSSTEVAEMTNRFLDSSAIREKMGQLRTKQERIAFQANLRSDMERNVKLGISFEQTFQMAEKMANFEQADVQDRMKSAAVAGMLAQQVGMSSADAAFIQQKGAGIKGASTQDQEKFARLMIELKAGITTELGRRTLGGEAALQSLVKQLGPLTATLDASESITKKAHAISEEQQKALQSNDSNLGEQTQALADIKNAFDTKLKPWLDDHATRIIVGVGGAISGLVMGSGGGGGGGGGGGLLSGVAGAAAMAYGPAMAASAGAAVGTALTVAANVAIPAAMVGAAGMVGYELGNAIVKPVADWGSDMVRDLTGWDAMDSLGSGLVSLAALVGVDSAVETKAIMAQTEATIKQTVALHSSEAVTAKLWKAEMYKRSQNKGKTIPTTGLSNTDPNSGNPDTPVARGTMVNTNAKRKSSLRQLESSIPKGIDYTRIPELENMKSSSTSSTVEIGEQTRLLEEQLKMLRELIDASKGTTGAVSKMHQSSKNDAKEQREAKAKADEDALNQIDLINSANIG